MRTMKTAASLLIAALVLAGCASKLGYPTKTVGIPTPVTLFSKVVQKPGVKNTMNYVARDIWDTLYKKQFEEILAKIPSDREHNLLNSAFLKNVPKATDLFSPSVEAVQNIEVDYSKAKDDRTAFSGFDFSQYKDTIATPYILALTIDEWGLLAAQQNKDNGPYITLTMQLIDKETNATIWKYTYLFQQQVDKDASELTNPEKFQGILDRLTLRSVDALFMWLGY